ncbi:uncharacterized protein [Fopius arisanus]|uniref:Uncharacterized protein n=1 Tax=Fopius arisanus TaxID=64838 RepID=A0A9R1U154_9HYME|nr:PREDICTED: uncharacterized protein LOC105266692 [Fopius arisanus]
MWSNSKACGKIGEIDSTNGVKRNEITMEHNCGVIGVGIVQKIAYNEREDHMHMTFSSACIRCGLCLAIADKIDNIRLTLYDTKSCDSYRGSADTGVRLSTICENSFSDFRLRELRGRRFIGENIPGSIIIKSSGDGLWGEKLRDKCEEILTTIEPEDLLKHLRDRCKTRDTNLRDILCQGRMGASRDCRGIFIPR